MPRMHYLTERDPLGTDPSLITPLPEVASGDELIPGTGWFHVSGIETL